MSETLGLIRLGSAEGYQLDDLKRHLSDRFPDYNVLIFDPLNTPMMAYDPVRGQCHSTRILVVLEGYAQMVGIQHLLGVTSLDLYVPGMNFVFGEARCPGRVAVISTYRLRTDPAENPKLLPYRVVKEAVHEIGHMLGLRHCSGPSCVMYFSERLADTDRKGANFCSECEDRMKLVEVE